MPPKQQQPVIEHGMFFYENGDVYTGDYIKEGEAVHRHGKGAYVCYSNETRAIPQVPEELKTLEEPVRQPNDIVRFEGEWQKDAFVEGEIVFANGCKYKGKLDGLYYAEGGTYTFADGLQYTGQFQKNMIHGIGTVTRPDGKTFGPGVYRNNFGEGLLSE